MAFILDKDKENMQAGALNLTQQVTDTIGATNGSSSGQNKPLATPNAQAFINANANNNTAGQSSRLTAQTDAQFQNALSGQNQKAQSFTSALAPPPQFSAANVGKSDQTTQAAQGFLNSTPQVQKQDYSARIDNPFESDKAFQNSLNQLNGGNSQFNRLDSYLAGKTGARDAARQQVSGQNQQLLSNAQTLGAQQDQQANQYTQNYKQAQANLKGDLQRQQDALYRAGDQGLKAANADSTIANWKAAAVPSQYGLQATNYVRPAQLGTQGDYLNPEQASEFNRLSSLLGGKAIGRSGVAPAAASFDQAAYDKAVATAKADAVRNPAPPPPVPTPQPLEDNSVFGPGGALHPIGQIEGWLGDQSYNLGQNLNYKWNKLGNFLKGK